MNLQPSFNFSLNNRIRDGCATSARVEPNEKETLVVVTASNKVFLKSTESALHITDHIRCISTAPYGDGYDVIVIGTESQIIAYDFYRNITLFQRDIADGASCLTVGPLAHYPDLVLVGGNCAIWGFDKDGKDVYWTVTGDRVNAICLADFDGDGEMELIVGSDDYEIRVFKNDLMRAELMETDAIVALQTLGGSRFAYALSNGTLGVYDKDVRQWRIKSKHSVASILAFPNQEYITCAWKGGKIDIRSGEAGDVVTKETAAGNVAASFVTRINDEMVAEVCIVYDDGKVKGFQFGESSQPVDRSQQVLREYGQMKHNLLMELSNYEHEETMSKAEKDSEFRIPANTFMEVSPRVDIASKSLILDLTASNDIPIRGVVLFAEGIFEGESHVWVPKDEGSNTLAIVIAPEKDASVDVHIKAFLGANESDHLHVFEVTRQLSRFCRFGILRTEDEYTQPDSYVEFQIQQRVPRILDWMYENFLVMEDYPPIDAEQESITLRFVGLIPREGGNLIIKFSNATQQMRLEYDEMETCGNIVQSLAEFFHLEHLESHASFKREKEQAETIIASLEGMMDMQDRLTTDLSEKQSILKETIVRAEDSRHIGEIATARKYYIRLKHADSAVKQAFQLKRQNYERFVRALRDLNKTIEWASKLRVGPPASKIVAACRDAIENDNLEIIPKIIEFGATQ